MPRSPPRSFVVLMQVARYLSSFTWALCGEGVFMFLCFDSAGIESLHSAVRLGATWALVLLGGGIAASPTEAARATLTE